MSERARSLARKIVDEFCSQMNLKPDTSDATLLIDTAEGFINAEYGTDDDEEETTQ